MSLTPMQTEAVEYVTAHPSAPVADLLRAVGVRGGADNQAKFLLRLLDKGALRVTLPSSNLHEFECVQSEDDLKTDLELTHTTCGTVLADVEHEDSLHTLLSLATSHTCPHPDTLAHEAAEERGATCRHCKRYIEQDQNGTWYDPEAPATPEEGDDQIWRETCDANDTCREAYHEPEEA